MPSVQEIVSFLTHKEDFRAGWQGQSAHLSEIITGIQPDQDAVKGHLAWISQKQAANHPERIATFQGSLLIAPLDLPATNRPIILCTKPKLAFILVVNEFFGDWMSINWPKTPDQIAPDAIISPDAQLSPGVVIGSRVIIEQGVEIGPNTVIANTHIKSNVRIGANCTLGLPGFGYEADEDGRYWRFPHTGGIVIYEDVEIGSNTCVDRGSIGNTVIQRGAKIDNLVHVAHNVQIGEKAIVIAHAMLGGSVIIGQSGWVAPSAAIMNQVTIGQSSVIGLGAVVLKDVEPYAVMVGNPAKLLKKNDPE